MEGATSSLRSVGTIRFSIDRRPDRAGVDVTLFATADSVTSARLRAVAPTGYSEDPSLDAKVREALHISLLFEEANEFDVIHNSFDFLPLVFSRLVEPLIGKWDSRHSHARGSMNEIVQCGINGFLVDGVAEPPPQPNTRLKGRGC